MHILNIVYTYVYVLNTFVRILRTYETRVAQLNAKHTNYSDTMIIRIRPLTLTKKQTS